MGPTYKALEKDMKKAAKQNGEVPRDLRFQRELDEFAGKRLQALSPDKYDLARDEYLTWLKDGYSQGRLGIKRTQIEVLDSRVSYLEIALVDERTKHSELKKSVFGIFDVLGDKVIRGAMMLGSMQRNLFQRLAVAVGFELPDVPDASLTPMFKSFSAEMAKEWEMEMSHPSKKYKDGPNIR